MKTSELLNLDMEEYPVPFKKALKKLPFGEKYPVGKPPVKVMEQYVSEISLKGKISMTSIIPSYIPGECVMYTGNALKRSTMDFLKVYGSSIYEVMVKICILMYVEDKKNENSR